MGFPRTTETLIQAFRSSAESGEPLSAADAAIMLDVIDRAKINQSSVDAELGLAPDWAKHLARTARDAAIVDAGRREAARALFDLALDYWRKRFLRDLKNGRAADRDDQQFFDMLIGNKNGPPSLRTIYRKLAKR